nr:hypothetical protein [Tanacetum cinerariifolium]
MSLFGQDVRTFTSTMLLNVDQLRKQLDKDEFQENGSMSAFWVVTDIQKKDKNKAKTDKTEHGMEKREKSKSTKVKVKDRAYTEKYKWANPYPFNGPAKNTHYLWRCPFSSVVVFSALDPFFLGFLLLRLGNTYLKSPNGSYSQAGVRRLSDFVVKLGDMPEGVEEEVYHDARPTLQILPFYCTPLATPNATVLAPTQEDLATATPNTKVLAKAKASKKKRAFIFRSALSQVAKRTRSGTTHSSGGKGIMNDDVDTNFESVDRSQAFTGTTPASQDPTDDAIKRDFFLFATGPYYDTYPKDGVVAGYYEFPTPGEMVRIEALTDNHLGGKMSILHYLMMSRGGELLSWYRGLESEVSCLKKHVTNLNDKVAASHTAFVKAKAKAKRKEQKKKIKPLSKILDWFITKAARLAFDLNQAWRSDAQKGDQITSSQTYLGDIYALMEGYKHSLGAKDVEILWLKASPLEFASFFRATPLVATIDYPFLNKVADHFAHTLSLIVELEHDGLARLTVVPTPRVVGVSLPLLKELTVTPAPSLVELFSNDAPPSSTSTLMQNGECLSDVVYTTDKKMVDAAFDKPMEVFVKGVAHPVCEDVNQV